VHLPHLDSIQLRRRSRSGIGPGEEPSRLRLSTGAARMEEPVPMPATTNLRACARADMQLPSRADLHRSGASAGSRESRMGSRQFDGPAYQDAIHTRHSFRRCLERIWHVMGVSTPNVPSRCCAKLLTLLVYVIARLG
jgi:hypothetical protein